MTPEQQKKGYFESIAASEMRDNTAAVYNMVAKDGFVKINHRSRPNMILMTEEHYLEILRDNNNETIHKA